MKPTVTNEQANNIAALIASVPDADLTKLSNRLRGVTVTRPLDPRKEQ